MWGLSIRINFPASRERQLISHLGSFSLAAVTKILGTHGCSVYIYIPMQKGAAHTHTREVYTKKAS